MAEDESPAKTTYEEGETNAPQPDAPIDATEHEFLEKLKAIIFENLADADMDVDGLCKKMGMGKTNLYKKMKALTGLTLVIYVRQLRLQRAQELLKDSDMNISEIAYAVGYNDPKFFSRIFKEEFGISPSDWKNGETPAQ